jgi:lantibiotic modifying enzyme
MDNTTIRQDIEHALKAISAAPIADADHVCCGNFGRIDFLLEAGKRLGRRELIAEAQHRASEIIRIEAKHGAYQVRAHVPGLPANPSFFQGTSGIGYLQLRLAFPDWLPCVLLWE